MRESERYGTARDPEIGLALSEAWSWLMTHGLVVRDPSGSSADSYKVSRLGRATLQHGVARLTADERLGVALHPRLTQRIQQQFLLGEFELAVFAAMKEVEVRVRDLAEESTSLLGVKLMQRAFAPETGVLTDAESDPGEKVATMELFRGAIGVFKNPSSHRPVDYDDPTLASEVILFADLLLRLLRWTPMSSVMVGAAEPGRMPVACTWRLSETLRFGSMMFGPARFAPHRASTAGARNATDWFVGRQLRIREPEGASRVARLRERRCCRACR